MSMTVATAILEQLGGNRFAAMTGARSFVGDSDSLTFRMGTAKDGINAVRVTLDPSDTYTMTFLKIRGAKVAEVARVSDVYCDTLAPTFESVTGFRTRL